MVRIEGDVVRRPVKPWTATVQALLTHLHAQGLPVPKPLGFDECDELVSLVAGEAGPAAWAHQVTLAGVQSAGALLRRVHDATQGWVPPADAVWSVPFDPDTAVICHGDPQPANMAWQQGRAVGLFDWDAARPGHRLDDVAYALEWLTPFGGDDAELRRRGFPGPPDRPARVDAFLEGYGWTEPFDVVESVLRRRRRSIEEVVVLGEQGHQPHADWVAAGWPARWRAGLEEIRALRAEFPEGWSPTT